jgi:hypothetical protein
MSWTTFAKRHNAEKTAVIPSRFIELGEQALATAVTNVGAGEPLVRCRLLASEFYRALKRELRSTSELGTVERPKLTVAANLFCHAVTANIGHDVMMKELKRAIDLLKTDTMRRDRLMQPRSKPVLRVIEGGLPIT